MRARALVGLLVALVLAPPAAAQRTADQARLVFSISGAYIDGRSLWRVPNQPVFDNTLQDVFALERRLRPKLGAALSGLYFPGDNLGFGLEAFLIGLGYKDSCRIVVASGSARNQDVCADLDGEDIGATSVAAAGTVVYRFNSRKPISPYVRGNAGLLVSSRSSIEMTSEILFDPTGEFPILQTPIYTDDRETDLSPTFAAGVGLTANISPGYQIRAEVRDNLVFLREVTAPASRTGLEPPHERKLSHLLSVMIGVDIVLERRRGRRY